MNGFPKHGFPKRIAKRWRSVGLRQDRRRNSWMLFALVCAIGAWAGSEVQEASMVQADEPQHRLGTQALATVDGQARPAVVEISGERIDELKQAGDRLADQGDYQVALEKYTLAYQGVVSRIRGQAFVHDVAPSIFNREQLGREMLKLIDEEYTPDELALMDQSYKVFGFVSPQLDTTALMTRMLTEEVAGFYDPKHKRMVLIVEDGPVKPPSFLGSLLGAKAAFDKDEQKTTLAHELTHALQDQLYGLDAMQESIKGDDDMSLAFSALVEGDATLLMFVEMDGEHDVTHMDPVAMRATFNIMSWMLPLAGGKTYRSAPAIFRDSLVFPYFQGMLFVLAVAGEGGWEAVHEVYSNPPLSTEQILHPDKYLRNVDLPQQVSLPDVSDVLADDWQRLGGNCLGELQTRILLKRVPGGSVAAAGWDGDRYDVYRNSQGNLALVYASVWDSPRDAEEFESAYRRYRQPRDPVPTTPKTTAEPAAAAKHPQPTTEPAQGADSENSVFASDTQSQIVLRGDKVFIVEGFTEPLAAQILQRLEKCQYVEKEFPQRKP